MMDRTVVIQWGKLDRNLRPRFKSTGYVRARIYRQEVTASVRTKVLKTEVLYLILES